MKFGIILFALLAWASCDDEKVIQKDVEILEGDGQWINMLATDGCSWHFEIPSGDSTLYYLPSDNALKEVEKVLGRIESSYSFTKVHVRYSLTGKKRDVQCGWGVTNAYDEIDIHEIRKN